MTEIINGTEICYRIEGEAKDRVLLLHGWGCSMNLMQPVADALKQDHQILLIDFPGHGESGRPPEPWGVPEYASCLLELLQQLAFIPCSVVAHSFGCRVAAWLEAEQAGFFRRSSGYNFQDYGGVVGDVELDSYSVEISGKVSLSSIQFDRWHVN